MKIGFTGTRFGMTEAQRAAVSRLLFEPDATEFHHGACVGSDEQAAVLVANTYDWIYIIAHPGRSASGGTNEHLSQIAIDVSDEVRDTDTHFARNRAIVDETDRLIATPRDMNSQSKGGTWYTINYAAKHGKPTTIVWPDGSETYVV